MSINLLETIQQRLGYPALHKIDPNTQQVSADEKTAAEDKFSQAAIPAVLTALYNYAQSDEGAEEILRGVTSPNWAGKIFEGKKKEAIQAISAYSNQSTEGSLAKMNAIANEAVKVVTENVPADAGIKEVKLFFSHQRTTILLYLPAELNMGALLHDTTLDDKTNKMEGPVSSFVKNIGDVFNKPVLNEETDPAKK